MDRQLNNTFVALGAAGTALVATLVLASAPPGDGSRIDMDAAIASDTPTLTLPLSQATGSGSTRLRSTVAMPYFSFVPRG